MMGIAAYMMRRNGYTNQIRSDDLDDVVQKLWVHFPQRLSPHGGATEGGQMRPLPERLAQTLNALETIQKDVRVGGVLVQDLSGRNVFGFAHKSYMEYLVSSFFVSHLLQNDYDRQLLMMSNAISTALNFRWRHLQLSPDVERFASELITSQIEIKDKQGHMLPIHENERQYSEQIFKKLAPNLIARWLPNLFGYASLHPSQRYFAWSVICLGFLGLVDCFYLNSTSNTWINSTSLLLYFSWFLIINYYQLLSYQNTNISPSIYIHLCSIYILACEQLKLPQHKIDESFSALVRLDISHPLYKSATIQIVSLNILLSGVNIGAFALAETFTFIETIAGAVAITFVVTFASVTAFTCIGIVAEGSALTCAGAAAGGILGTLAFASADAGVILAVFAGTATGTLLLYIRLKRVLTKIRTEIHKQKSESSTENIPLAEGFSA